MTFVLPKFSPAKILRYMVLITIVTVHTGASYLGGLLKVSNSLQDLVMGWNDIGDHGMSSVADGLQYNNALTNLDIHACGLSVKGSHLASESYIVYCIQKRSN